MITTITTTTRGDPDLSESTITEGGSPSLHQSLPAAFWPDSSDIANLAGSAIATDNEDSKTTYTFNCRSDVSVPCVSFEVPVTAAVGPSRVVYTVMVTEDDDSSSTVTTTRSVTCSSESSSWICATTYTSEQATIADESTYADDELMWVTLDITDGQWVLDTAYPSPAPTETASSTSSTRETGGLSSDSEPGIDILSDSRSRSKVWIAGPVTGGVVVLILLVGAIVFWRRRRRRQSGQAFHLENKVAELEGKDRFSDISELPVNEVATAELPSANRDRLFVYELPA
ncbi:hypothetical protein BDV12DRAFT_7787 [Aspergillus spectabilis]